MIKKWIGRLTTKQIIISLVMVAVAIYIVWYVIDSLEGLDTNYKPMRPAGGGSPKVGNEFFDPTKTTPQAMPSK